MMYNKLLASQPLQILLIIVAIYVSQIHLLTHTFHAHSDELTEVAIDSHEGNHRTDHHHHHDADSSHANDHLHDYQLHIYRQNLRIQNLTNIQLVDFTLVTPTDNYVNQENKFSLYDEIEPNFKEVFFTSSFIVRGPPSIL